MAILTEQMEDVQGFQKEIEASAMDAMMDVLQKYQYSYPQKSAIRELVCNSLDAIRERDIALGIISGRFKEEDYFIHRDGDLYKDSNFDRNYYDPKWLWSILDTHDKHLHPSLYAKRSDKVYITYVDGGDTKKDKLFIEDFGVGMGGRRVERYFSLGFSTKRNTKSAIGKFGIGAKAGLAAAPFYTMTTRYNGREYSFNIYPHQIMSIVPQLNTETGKSNGLHLFENGARIWYRATQLPNGTTIEIESKKHHRGMYIDAVKSQLLYFPEIELRTQNQYGGIDIIPHAADILYEDELIILSDNTQFSKPHILVDKVNYGNLDFKEMELEDKHGNIGIKVASEDVTVNPSRETVIWDDKTRDTVVSAFNKVVGIAERLIAKQLQVEDFIEWVRTCQQIKHSYSNGSVLERLSKVVDLNGVAIPYSKDQSIVFGRDLFAGLNVRMTQLDLVREGSLKRYQIKRLACGTSGFDQDMPVIIQHGRVSFKKDKYILTELYPNGFIAFQVPFQAETPVVTDGNVVISAGITAAQAREIFTPIMKDAVDYIPKLTRESLVAHMDKITAYVLASKEVIDYEAIEVPKDFDDSEEFTVEEEAASEDGKEARKMREKLQREAGVIPIFTPRNAISAYVTSKDKGGTKLYEWQKLEMIVDHIDKWDNEEVFYATEAKIGKDEDGVDIIEAELLHLAAAITRPTDVLVSMLDMRAHTTQYSNPNYADNVANTALLAPYKVSQYEASRLHNFTGNPKVKLIKVAQDRRKYFLDFKPIQRFFLDIKGKTLTMSNALVRWNTARVIEEGIGKLQFLRNFGLFHQQFSGEYKMLQDYVSTNYRNLKDHAADSRFYGLRESSYDDLVRHCDKVMKFQLLVRATKDNPNLIAQAAQELFAPQQEITDGLAIDVNIYDIYLKLLDYAEPIRVLLNQVGKLTSYGADIPDDLELEIRSYLQHKGVTTN